MVIRILVDWKYEGKIFIENELEKRDIQYAIHDIPDYSMKDRTQKFRIINLYLKYLIQAFKVLSLSSEKDLVICLNFTTAIAVGLANKFERKKLKILALNIIAPKRHGLVDRMRFLLYHNIMKSPNFYITVNSKEYISEYSIRFKVDAGKFFVLHDAIISTNDTMDFIFSGSYVFCGGEAKRDWNTMLRASEACPELKFVFIARKKYLDPKLKLPENVTMIYDVEENEFYNYLKMSSLVALPLQTKLPAGLIVLLKCAMYHKPVIITRTPSTENYVEDNKSGFLIELNDYQTLALKIKSLFYNPGLQESFSNELYNRVIKFHSPESRALNLLSIIDCVQQN